MSADSGRLSGNGRSTADRAESQYSRHEPKSTQGRWDRDSASDFAITSVNVPDRLDTQEVWARASADAERPTVRRFHPADIARFSLWVLAAVVAGALIWGGLRWAATLRAAVAPAGLEASVGQALGVPVSVGGSEFEFLPSPRLLITDLVAQSEFKLPVVTVRFSWRDAVRALQSGNLEFGEARVAPLELTREQALALLKSVHGAARLPGSISSLRFESVSFADSFLLPGRYEAMVRREGKQRGFGDVRLKRLDDAGEMEIEIAPPPTAAGNARFTLFAKKWLATAGPPMVWSDVAASGEFREALLKVDSFSVSSRFGGLNGAASLAWDGRDWRIAGAVRAPSLNVEELLRHAAGSANGDVAAARVFPLRGNAKVELSISGSGATAEEALRRAAAVGTASLSGATFSGLNLGQAATQGSPVGAGGVTRFSDLVLDVSVSAEGLRVRRVDGRAGGLRVQGAFNVDRKLQLSGALRPEVVSPRGAIGTQIRLGGSADAPIYQ